MSITSWQRRFTDERTGSIRQGEPVCRLGRGSPVRNTSSLPVTPGFRQVLLLPSNEIVSSEVNDSTRVSGYTNLVGLGEAGGEVLNASGPRLPAVTFTTALASATPGDERGPGAGNSRALC